MRTASKSIFHPTKDSRRGLIFNQSPQQRPNKQVGGLFKTLLPIGLATLVVGFLVVELGPKLQTSIVKELISSPHLDIEVQGTSEFCGSEKLRQLVIGFSSDIKSKFENIAGFLAEKCLVDSVAIELRGLTRLRVVLERQPNIFFVECSQLEKRLVSRTLKIYPDGGQLDLDHLVRLEGFDKMFCRAESIQPDAQTVGESLVAVYDRLKDGREKLKVIRSRLPRGIELFLDGVSSSFIFKLDSDAAQYKRLSIALQSKIPPGSVVSLDLDGKLLISRSEPSNDSLK